MVPLPQHARPVGQVMLGPSKLLHCCCCCSAPNWKAATDVVVMTTSAQRMETKQRNMGGGIFVSFFRRLPGYYSGGARTICLLSTLITRSELAHIVNTQKNPRNTPASSNNALAPTKTSFSPLQDKKTPHAVKESAKTLSP